jgi:cyclophilin family peptidyl-prolyl cis-trans isomerase
VTGSLPAVGSRTKLHALLVTVVLGVLALAACGDDDSDGPTAPSAAEGCSEADAPPPKDVSFEKPERVLEPGESATATMETSCGTFTIRLDTKGSPKTANSFAFLAEQGFYDGTVFHRIVPGFVIQGGDPEGTGTGGPGYFVDEPPADDTAYLKGDVAMAKTQVEPPGRSGSQFYVVTAADAGLQADYAVLGHVVEGIDVVESIGELGDPATEEPTQTVTLDSVTIESG